MRKSINQVVAAALHFYMVDRWNQTTLGKAAGLAPNTVGNAIHPGRRETSKSGKEPSIKVTELDQIARALDVPISDLVSDLTDEERRQRQRERAAEHYKRHGVLPDWAPTTAPRKRDGTHG